MVESTADILGLRPILKLNNWFWPKSLLLIHNLYDKNVCQTVILEFLVEVSWTKNTVVWDVMPCIGIEFGYKFYVRGSVHRESMWIIVQRDATMYSLLYFCKLLYMFRVVTPPIIRSTYNCNYSIWHWSNFGKCSVWSQLKMRGMDSSTVTFRVCRR